MKFSFRVEGLDRLQRILGINWRPVIQAITWAIGELIRNKIAVYPPSPRHPIHWTSAKQRRAYFAMRRARGLPIAYTRQFDPLSQRLGPSWTVSRYSDLSAKVGTRTTYAPYVQDAERQQPMHRDTGWVTDKQAVEAVRQSGDVRSVAVAAVRKALGL